MQFKEERLPITLDDLEFGCVVRLGGVIDIGLASELKETLIQALDSGREIQIELGGVTEVDVTALQLLWAADQAAHQSGARLGVCEPIPENVLESLQLAGLENFFAKTQ
jgi:anti-anti-sigma factor